MRSCAWTRDPFVTGRQYCVVEDLKMNVFFPFRIVVTVAPAAVVLVSTINEEHVEA